MACCGSSTAFATWSISSLKSVLPSVPVQRTPPLHFSIGSSPTRLRVATLRNSSPGLLQSFVGLAPLNPLLSLSSLDSFGFEHSFTTIDNGGRFFAMRHGRKVPKLNRPPDQRRALLRGLTTQLLKHGRIKTTRARASAMRKYVDKMITLAKDGSLHKRRQALGFIYEKQIVHALFAEVQERYGDRNGGYTRIIRTLPRRGDNAPMAFIELV
ncbi:unnamed protein product [Coffea canephora]|uniref:Large ribosomal subunit protein bL17c n=2 Tax=Coffea TaxID=13442 RepID=A0A068U6S2_COFCA|nr:50S ribosomal protein L17, chloroplastic [Coffea arabica]CDP04017.1 unnamed protein product [Coffea canephora]